MWVLRTQFTEPPEPPDAASRVQNQHSNPITWIWDTAISDVLKATQNSCPFSYFSLFHVQGIHAYLDTQ